MADTISLARPPMERPTVAETQAINDDRTRSTLAILVVIQFICLISYIIWMNGKLNDTQMILGAEISFVVTVLNYYFGSSATSTATAAVRNKQVETNSSK